MYPRFIDFKVDKTLKHTLEYLEDKNITDMVTLNLEEYKNLRYRGNVINQHVTPNMTELRRRMKMGCL